MGASSDGEQVTSAGNQQAEADLLRTLQSVPEAINDPAARLYAGHFLAENPGLVQAAGVEGAADILTGAVTARGMPQSVVDGYHNIFLGVLEPYDQGKASPVTPAPQPPEHGADPIELYRGEFVHEQTDLVVRGAGIDFAFVRTYRNQAVFDGVLGSKWDHAYNTTLQVTDIEARLWTGTMRTEVYRRHPKWGQAGFTYYVPEDGLHATVEPIGVSDAPTGWARRAIDGLRHIFEPDPDWSGGFRLGRIEDRFGNYLRFLYIDGQLRKVEVNHPARWAQFAYDALGRIVDIADHTGRAWQYAYDDNGDLTLVTTPPTPGSPEGSSTSLSYSSSERTGALAHNLTRIIDANGRCYLENRYGDGPTDFNRVVWQRQGGGVMRFRYELVDPVFVGDLPPEDRPTMRVRVAERNGFETINVYNGWGNPLRREECWQGPNGHEHVVWRFRYNRDGLVVASRTPEGVVACAIYGRTNFVRRRPGLDEDSLWQHDDLTADVRRSFSLVLAIVRRAQPLAGSDFEWNERWGDPYVASADDVIVKHTYEPAYGQPLTTSDPRATASPDPDGVEGPAFAVLLTRSEYDGPPGDPTLALKRIIHPTPIRADRTPYGAVVEEILARDDRGRILAQRDAAGTETTYDYYLDADGARAGFLQRQVVDTAGSAPLAVTTEHDVDELGRVIATTRPRGVESADGRFVVRASYDALDRVTSRRSPTPLDTETRMLYERTGPVARTETDWTSPGKVGLGSIVRTFEYDEEHHVTRETLGGTDLAQHLLTRHRYGLSGERTLTLLPGGNDIRFRYDQRVQLIATIRGYATADAASARVIDDRDSRTIETITPEGRTTTLELDALGRAIAVTDALGHITRTTYDKGGRAIVVRHFERRQDGTYWLLARGEVEYDELGRKRREIANRFDDALAAADVSHDYELTPGPGTRVITTYEYDAAGRLLAVIDPLARRMETAYDALGRVATTTDALGNRIEFRYDAQGNVVRRDRRDVVRDDTGTIIGEEVFPWEGTYDERDRLVGETDALGNVTSHAYDSLDRPVSTTDPLGNVVVREYDTYGRQTAITRLRTATGRGGGQPLQPATIRAEYDKNGNVIAQVDPMGRRIDIRYDSLDRPVERIFPSAQPGAARTSVRTYYDKDSLEIRRREAHGAVIVTTRDGLGHPVETSVDLAELDAGLVVEGAQEIARRFDGLGRTSYSENDNAAIATQFDSLGQATRSDTAIAGLSFALIREYDDTGALSAIVYPGGRRIEHDRDELHRLVALNHAADGIGYPGAVGAPRTLARRSYVGGRIRAVDHGNGTRIEQAFDAGGRLIERRHLGPARLAGRANLLRLQYLDDGARNPRLLLEDSQTLTRAERLDYDSEYQLLARRDDPGRSPFDPGSLAPAGAPPTTPIPDRQSDLDALLGPLPSAAGDAWTYDLNGNRSRETLAAGLLTDYQTNDLDQYTTVAGAGRTYDRAGNLIADDRFTYVYDAFFRLVRVTDRNTSQDVARYAYDPGGRRVSEEHASGGLMIFAHDGPDRIADYRDTTCVAQYVHADSVDDVAHVAASALGTPSEQWVHTDAIGSVRVLSDSVGAASATRRYAPFGAVEESVGLTGCPFAFAGRPLDDTVSLYDFRARAYDPRAGRFLQRDPSGPTDGPNLYGYVGNHPLRFTDPSGYGRPEIVGSIETGNVSPGTTQTGLIVLPDQGATNVNTPTRSEPVVPFLNRDTGAATTIRVRDAQTSAQYVDNVVSVGTDADPMTATFNNLTYLYKDGRSLDVPLSAVHTDQSGVNPLRFEQAKGIIYPVDASGNAIFDPGNTPNIVAGANMKLVQQAQARATNAQYASLIYTFAGAVGALGGVAGMAPSAFGTSSADTPRTGAIRRSSDPKGESGAGPASEQFFIENGVRRSIAAREAGLSEVPATIFRPGEAPETTSLRLDQLHSPKSFVPIDARFLRIQPPIQTPIQVQPLGLPGQGRTTPLGQVKLGP